MRDRLFSLLGIEIGGGIYGIDAFDTIGFPRDFFWSF